MATYNIWQRCKGVFAFKLLFFPQSVLSLFFYQSNCFSYVVIQLWSTFLINSILIFVAHNNFQFFKKIIIVLSTEYAISPIFLATRLFSLLLKGLCDCDSPKCYRLFSMLISFQNLSPEVWTHEWGNYYSICFWRKDYISWDRSYFQAFQILQVLGNCWGEK